MIPKHKPPQNKQGKQALGKISAIPELLCKSFLFQIQKETITFNLDLACLRTGKVNKRMVSEILDQRATHLVGQRGGESA